MELKSRVREHAIVKGYANINQLSKAAGVEYTTVKAVWLPGSTMANIRLGQAVKIAKALKVRVTMLWR